MWFPALLGHVDFLNRCLILLNRRVQSWSIFEVQVSENGNRPSRFLADCNGVAGDRIRQIASRESIREKGGGTSWPLDV